MRYCNSSLKQHHLALFAPLAWLERLEEQQHHGADQYAPEAPLPAPLHATLIGLNTALIGLQQALRFEQAQLSVLFENAGKSWIPESLNTKKQRLGSQINKLLDVLSLIQSLANTNALHREPQRPIEDCWDETAVLIPELSEQLIRYLHLAETRYLPLADQLLSVRVPSSMTAQPNQFLAANLRSS